MKKVLQQNVLDKGEAFIRENCRPIDAARFNFYFRGGSAQTVTDELKKYQNEDGGFGHGLESDFWVPDSSAIASTIGFQFIRELGNQADQDMIRRGIEYFESTFIPERQGWITVPPTVNNYPHAMWWDFNTEAGGTVIDETWGNPTAEILGYLYTYSEYVKELDIFALIDEAFQRYANKEEYTSEHELYCYTRLANNLTEEKRGAIISTLKNATKQLLCTDPEQWHEYKPQPLHFVDSKEHFLYEEVAQYIKANLDFLVETVDEDGMWYPTWTWMNDYAEWKQARIQWAGVKTVMHFKLLRAFGRIE